MSSPIGFSRCLIDFHMSLFVRKIIHLALTAVYEAGPLPKMPKQRKGPSFLVPSYDSFYYICPVSYVDPLGSLISVRYTAGPDGYLETRNVQEGFVTIRQVAAPARPLAVPAPVPAPAPTPAPAPAQANDSDLVNTHDWFCICLACVSS